MDEMTSPRPYPTPGFSLVELLIVIAMVGLLTVLAIPALNSVMRGSNITLAGQTLSDELALARQDAVSRNRDVQVRFYYLTNAPSPGWRAVQLWRIDQGPEGPVTNAASRLVQIPEGIVIATNNNLSPLITSAPLTGTNQLPGYGQTRYAGFRFRANGSLENTVTAARGFLTLTTASDDSGQTPLNYYTIQLNPLTGKTLIFRPQ